MNRHEFAAVLALHGWEIARTDKDWIGWNGAEVRVFSVRHRTVSTHSRAQLPTFMANRRPVWASWNANVAPYWVLRWLLEYTQR